MIATTANEGLLYRALNPRWAADPLSGDGAALYGGRFNARSTPVLYTSLSPVTAMKEAQQVGTFQPITLVAYQASIPRLFDGRDTDALEAFGMMPVDLADPDWRDAMRGGRPAPTQNFAARLKEAGIHGLLVPSFAPGADADDLNIVVFAWNSEGGATLRVIDDENRLARPD
ncbi:RES family NAD+ phosphorylase [Thermaurantiacus sp.]